MHKMSRRTTREYIATQSEEYLGEQFARKGRILDEICHMTGYSRKYVINLLNGKIRFRVRKGRGKTYTDSTRQTLVSLWREAGCPCAPYLKALMPRWIDEYSSTVVVIKAREKEQLLAMSARTIARLLENEPRVKPGWSRSNKRSGAQGRDALKKLIPCSSGERIRASRVPPGDVQIDTFACGGGNPAENFFWILTVTDRNTQWTVLSPTWNRGCHSTQAAFDRTLKQMPFAIQALHTDNGGEFINYHLPSYLATWKNPPFVWRSRPGRCNDNAHVEGKNRSVGRALLGEVRLDCPELEAELIALCKIWSDYTNFCCPSRMLLEKVARTDKKGFRGIYDTPKTPFQRVLESGVLTDEQARKLEAYNARLNGIELVRLAKKKLRRIKRLQEEYNRAKARGEAKGLPEKDSFGGAAPSSSLRDAPSGTDVRRPAKAGKKPESAASKKERSTQYLANQQPPPFLTSTLSI